MGKMSRFLLLGGILFMIVAILISLDCTGRTIVVDDSGGTECSSIQEGVDAASPGDTVLVCSGTYVERVSISKSITLKGEDAASTFIVIDEPGDGIQVTEDHVEIEGFTITGAQELYFYNGYHAITIDEGDYCDVRDCRLIDNWGGIEMIDCYGSSIVNNLIVNDSYHESDFDAITMVNSNFCNVLYNTIRVRGGFTRGIDLSGGIFNCLIGNNISYCYSGIFMIDCLINNVSSNILSHNEHSGLHLYSSAEATIIMNNTITDNGNAGIFLWKESNNCTIMYNHITSNLFNAIDVMAANDTVIKLNYMEGNQGGIDFQDGKGRGNSVTYNVIWGDQGRAINLDGTQNNIHHNTFLIDAWGYGPKLSDDGAANVWDDSYGMGNYYSRYIHSYPSAKAVNGVWDMPYEISGEANSSDRFPSVLPWVIPSEPLELSVEWGDGYASLDWEPPASEGNFSITHYLLQREGPNGTVAFETNGPVTAFHDSTVIDGETYYYLVRAVTAFGKGLASAEVRAKPGTPLVCINSSNELGIWSSPETVPMNHVSLGSIDGSSMLLNGWSSLVYRGSRDDEWTINSIEGGKYALEDGVVYCAKMGHDDEWNTIITFAVSEDHGGSWSTQRTVVELEGYSENSYSLSIFDGTLLLCYCDTVNGTGNLKYMRSLDGGDSWTAPALIDEVTISDNYGVYRPVLINGVLYLVYYDSTYGWSNTCIYLTRSADMGQSWMDKVKVATNGSLMELAYSDSILHLSYYNTSLRSFSYTRSNDADTWSTPITVAHLVWGTDASLYHSLTANGDQVFVAYIDYRDSEPRAEYCVRINASNDGGITWSEMPYVTESETNTENPYLLHDGESLYFFWKDNGYSYDAPQTIYMRCLQKDSDGDGIADPDDLFPLDPSEWSDNDSDGIGDNGDEDDDNDGMTDEWEELYGLDKNDDSDALEDLDADGVSNLQEFLDGTDPSDPSSFVGEPKEEPLPIIYILILLIIIGSSLTAAYYYKVAPRSELYPDYGDQGRFAGRFGEPAPQPPPRPDQELRTPPPPIPEDSVPTQADPEDEPAPPLDSEREDEGTGIGDSPPPPDTAGDRTQPPPPRPEEGKKRVLRKELVIVAETIEEVDKSRIEVIREGKVKDEKRENAGEE